MFSRSRSYWPATRMAAILVGVGLIDGLAVAVAAHPLPWAAVIPGLIPLLGFVFVQLPIIRDSAAAPGD